MRPEDRAERISAFEALCRVHRLAITVQRRAIFEAVLARSDHPTADQVYADVRERLRGISRTTVYRVLEALARIGAIARACHPGTAARYDPVVVRHHHLVCLRCEKVVDFNDPQFDTLPLPQGTPHGFAIQDLCVHLRGLCAACRRAVQPRQKPDVPTHAGPAAGARVRRRKKT